MRRRVGCMSEVIITVRGEHQERVAPERAKISVSVQADGPDKSEVVDRVLRLAEPVRSSLAMREEPGAVSEWSSARMSVRAERPWNQDGKRLAPVYYASVDFTATFVDPSELSLWVTEISAWEGVNVGYVDWQLTPETQAKTEREVATEAIKVAVARATAYADALGLKNVEAREIADQGLISDHAVRQEGRMMKSMAFAAMDATAGAGMEFAPEDILVSATVEGRFAAS